MSSEPRLRRHLILDADRLRDVEEKHARIRQLLLKTGAEAVLLQDPANIAWFAAGADVSRFSGDSIQTSLFITADARLFATNAVDSTMIFEREAFGLGFQLKQREWYQPHAALVDDLARGRRVVSDSGIEGTRNATRLINACRLPLTALEVDRLRKLSRVLVHAVQSTSRNIEFGMTEAAVAGEISHRLLKRTVQPVRIQVAADGRNERYRHWGFGEDPIQSFAVISCTARRWGLHATVTRTVVLDQLPAHLWDAFQKTLLIHGTGIFFSRRDKLLSEVWPKVRRIYEKFDAAHEWQMADQADVTGYRASEVQLTPASDFMLAAGIPITWHPSVGPASAADTILITENGCEFLTKSDDWPEMTVQVKGHDLKCPGLLRIGRPQQEVPVTASHKESDQTIFSRLRFEDDEPESGRVDSIWEMELCSDRSIFESDDAAYSEESVLD